MRVGKSVCVPMERPRVCAAVPPVVYDLPMAVSTLPSRTPGAAAPRPATDTVAHWIGGRAVSGAGALLDVFNPATGEVARRVALATAEEVRAAVVSASSAWPAWADTPPVRR